VPIAKELLIQFVYGRPKRLVYDWWTDLSGTGYVGKALKSVRPVGKDGEKTLVETKWKILGMKMTLVEKLTMYSEDHWTWEPHLLGIYITDEFRLAASETGKTRMTIDSVILPRGMKGKLMLLLLERKLDRMMRSEWESASVAFVEESAAKSRDIVE
jgi:hypothetical protein